MRSSIIHENAQHCFLDLRNIQPVPQQKFEDNLDFKTVLVFTNHFLNEILNSLFLSLGGYCWAYNTRLYFGEFYPDFDSQLGWWIFADSLVKNKFGTVFIEVLLKTINLFKKKFQVGGSFGVFFGGFFSDRIVAKLGLHSRLWVLSAFTLLSVPFACLTLYFEVSYIQQPKVPVEEYQSRLTVRSGKKSPNQEPVWGIGDD